MLAVNLDIYVAGFKKKSEVTTVPAVKGGSCLCPSKTAWFEMLICTSAVARQLPSSYTNTITFQLHYFFPVTLRLLFSSYTITFQLHYFFPVTLTLLFSSYTKTITFQLHYFFPVTLTLLFSSYTNAMSSRINLEKLITLLLVN